ncbi:MAG: histidine kinase [Flavobacteriaceae bacterium]|nr:histidine kinase [Flavobacteriaceae bacterium]
MKTYIQNIIIVCSVLVVHFGFSQKVPNLEREERFVVRGVVIESDTGKPLEKVNIEINGGAYTTTNVQGEFKIEVKKNDELVVRHRDFETVYYSIRSKERIRVEVMPQRKYTSGSYISKMSSNTFNNLIDSAEVYKKTDVDKSLQFAADALKSSSSSRQNAVVYEILADIYMYWKQYDLSVTNYRISLQNVRSNAIELKLANAYMYNKNYQESLDIFNAIDITTLSNWQRTVYYEGMGNVYYLIKKYQESIAAYKEGLAIAKAHLITPKITDFNSLIAKAYETFGAVNEAKNFYQNSLSLAENENKGRALEEKVKVADFQNRAQAYDTEIQLRKQALDDIEDIEIDSMFDNTSALTSQKQKYKIGNAYALQKDFFKAIPFLKESIEEADDRADLVVKKDATRKLSEVYRDAGNLEKALLVSREYERLVDEIYIKKEQEISQAARFREDITSKQNRILSLEKDRVLSESKYQLTIARNQNQKIIIYALIVGLVLLLTTLYFMRKHIKQQRLNNNLLALKSLRSQMNPHFIFNALNSVNSFIAMNDERTANRYLSDFSMLMRAVLENSEEDFILLEKELELLRLYIKLEHFRFQDKFDYTINVGPKVKVNTFQIPPMLLQPYIENAVWHGLRYKKTKGELHIDIVQKSSEEITITIIDNGIGRQQSRALKTQNQKKYNSKGMGNVKKRVQILNEMYRDKVDVTIDDYLDKEDTGTKVVVKLRRD